MTSPLQFRAAFWAMLTSLGLMIVVAIPSPEPAKRMLIAQRNRSATKQQFAHTTIPNGKNPNSKKSRNTSAQSISKPHRRQPQNDPVAKLDMTGPGSRRLDTKPNLQSNANAGPASVTTGPKRENSSLASSISPFNKPRRKTRLPVTPVTRQTNSRHFEDRSAHRTRGGIATFVEVGPRTTTPSHPIVELGPIEAPNKDVANLPVSSGLSMQLASLQRTVDRLAQVQFNKQITDLERATQSLQQLQQSGQIQNLERRLEDLRSGSSKKDPNSPKSDPPPAEPAAENSTEESKTETNPTVLKAEPSGDGSEKFSLQIQDAEITEVLDMLGQLSGTNILVSKEVKGKVSANLHDVTVEDALNALLRSNGYVHEIENNFLYVTSAAEAERKRQLNRKLITKVYRPHYISVADLQALIAPLLTQTIGKVAVTNPNEKGIASNPDDAGGDMLSQVDALVVQDYPEVIKEIDGVLLEMDVPPLQVVIEAKILSVSLTDEMKLGVNFALLGGSGRDFVTSGRGDTLNAASGLPNGTAKLIGQAGQFVAATAGLKYGFIRGDIAGFIEALESITDTNLIAAPQLRVLNKQRAELSISKQLGYITTLSVAAVGTQQQINFIDVGTKLFIRPFIAPDGLVRLEVHPERSGGEIDSAGIPQTNTTQVTTNVMVRDGTTVVIGGLIDEQITDTSSRVPFLGSIPVLGLAFRNKTEKVVRSELIILLTPRIVREPDAEIEGDAARFEFERQEEYFRDNLVPFNRRNLARLHYERAIDHFKQNNYLRAKYHVDTSLKIRPNDLDAHHLRDQIEVAIDSQKSRWFGLRPGSDSPQEVKSSVEFEVIEDNESGPRTDLPPVPGN